MANLLAQLELGAGARLDAVCVGTAGTGSAVADAFYVGLLSPLTAAGQVTVVNDALLVLAAAGVADGIACVAGTGSKTVGLLGGQEERAGGWGYLLGDEGSGYWVVREAVRELALRQDSHAPLGQLGRAVLAAVKCPDVTSLLQAWYERPAPDLWAAMAPVVLDCRDSFAEDLTERAARALATAVSSVHLRLGSPAAFPVVLSGGLVTGHGGLAAATLRAVHDEISDAEVMVATEPPLTGAVRLALAAAGETVGPRTFAYRRQP
jgi:N-acetylglucosamine kinase-like BadF-type ATPase